MRRAVRMTVAAAAIAGVMAAAPAVARAGCLWQPSMTAPIDGVSPSWMGLAADSPTDAWLFGVLPNTVEHWDGSAWTADPSLIEPSAGDARAPDDVWQVGATPGTQIADSAHFDGSSWSEVPMVNRAGGPTEIMDVSVVSPSIAWAGGWHYTTLAGVIDGVAEHWTGTRWVDVDVPPSRMVMKVAALSRNDVWALIQPREGALVEAIAHRQGTTWSVVEPQAADVRLTDISARSRDDVWVTGYETLPPSRAGSNQTRAVSYHFDGSAWTFVPVPDRGHSTALWSVSAAKRAATLAIGRTSSRGLIVRFARGAWHIERTAVPTPLLDLVAAVPGTTQGWAVDGEPVVHHRLC